MKQPRLKNALVVAFGLTLASLGVYNIVLKATWSVMDDLLLVLNGQLRH